ncbi:MAG: aquaporin Z [Actinobacteria bacterium]|nr:aquaporin Z [Actinomycetota bacterium]
MEHSLPRRMAAAFLGTLWLVLGCTGAAVLAAGFPDLGIGFLGVAFAFGLTVLTGAHALACVSGAHFNPAVSIGLWAGGRFPARELPAYIMAQLAGGIAGSAILLAVASGKAGFSLSDGFAANGYGDHSPGGYTLAAVIVAEIVMTAFFVFVIQGATDKRAPAAIGPLAIGFALTLIHLITIPVSSTSVNPARSLAPAVFVGDWALAQLWVFFVFPIVGGMIGGLIYRFVMEWPGGAPGTERLTKEALKLEDVERA